jgi:hypothetical protein
MSKPSSEDILKKIFAALTANSALMALVGNQIYNYVPQDSTPPFIRCRWVGAADWDTKDSDGLEGTIQIDIWTEHKGMLVAYQISDKVQNILHLQTLSTVSQNLLTRLTMQDSFVEPDGITNHTVQRYSTIITN